MARARQRWRCWRTTPISRASRTRPGGAALLGRARKPGVRVSGVEPASADDARRTLLAGAIQTLDHAPDTIADGVRTTAIGRRNFEGMVGGKLIHDIVTVTEGELQSSLSRAWLDLKLAIEATAALPLAAFLAGRLPVGD